MFALPNVNRYNIFVMAVIMSAHPLYKHDSEQAHIGIVHAGKF